MRCALYSRVLCLGVIFLLVNIGVENTGPLLGGGGYGLT